MRRFPSRRESLLTATVAALLLSGAPPARVDAATMRPINPLTQRLPHPHVSVSGSPATPIVYVAETAANAVVVYPQSGPLTPLATITHGLSAPTGTWVDQQQDLWVANAGTGGHPGFLLVFAPNTSEPLRKIAVPAVYGPPQQVWVDSDGTVYTVECQDSACNIAQYDTGGKWHNINDPDLSTVTGIVGDGAGDLYAEGVDAGTKAATVEVLAGGTWQTIYFPFFTKPAQIAWDQNGELVIESAAVGNIFYYLPSGAQFSGAFLCPKCYALAPSVVNRNLFWWTLADGTLKEYNNSGGLQEQLVLPAGSAPASVAVSPALFP